MNQLETNAFRSLSSGEESIIRKLLEQPFAGRDELLVQLGNCQVKTIDNDGGLQIQVGGNAVQADTVARVPVEAEARDADGATLHLLLHVVDGHLNELEIYREDGGTVQEFPTVERIAEVHAA